MFKGCSCFGAARGGGGAGGLQDSPDLSDNRHQFNSNLGGGGLKDNANGAAAAAAPVAEESTGRGGVGIECVAKEKDEIVDSQIIITDARRQTEPTTVVNSSDQMPKEHLNGISFFFFFLLFVQILFFRKIFSVKFKAQLSLQRTRGGGL